MKITKLYITALGAFFAMLFTLNVSAQQYKIDSQGHKIDATDFVLFVEKANNSITLKCVQGCDWADLKLTLNRSQIQALDEFGTKDSPNIDTRKSPNLANFLITIEQTDKGVSLKGIQGTEWGNLNIDLSNDESQAINKEGVMKPE